MGGHGALTLGIKSVLAAGDDAASGALPPFRSVSAFSPICHPSNCPWGRTAFEARRGMDLGIYHAMAMSALWNARMTFGARRPLVLHNVGCHEARFARVCASRRRIRFEDFV